jgi:hypothetical protein
MSIMSMLGGETTWGLSRVVGVGGDVVTAVAYETLMRRLGILRGVVSNDSSGSFGFTEQNRLAMR